MTEKQKACKYLSIDDAECAFGTKDDTGCTGCMYYIDGGYCGANERETHEYRMIAKRNNMEICVRNIVDVCEVTTGDGYLAWQLTANDGEVACFQRSDWRMEKIEWVPI